MHKDFICFGKRSEMFSDLVYKAQFFGFPSTRSIAGYLGVSTRTVERWCVSNNAPDSVWRLLLLATGDLGALHPEWKGWVIKSNGLFDPEGRRVDRTTFELCSYDGTPATKARQRANEAERTLKFFTEALAGFLASQPSSKPVPIKVMAADGTEYVLSPA